MMKVQIPDAEAQVTEVAAIPGIPDVGDLSVLRLASSDYAGQPASIRKSAPRRRPLILVVDDEPDILFVTKTRIQMSGYDVAEAVDGEMALEKIEELHPDLVLLDLKMPKLNGYQVCKTVKADPNLRNTVIVVCSASSSLSLSPERRSLEIGADAYIRKPYDVKKLLDEISRLLSQKKANERSAQA
jgi:CheY-like chemotaxis protein